MIDEVVAGVLVDAVVTAGRRLGGAASAWHGRRYAEDVAIARWFDTYRLTERPPALPDLSPEAAASLAEVLREDEVQGVLHELLAARLTDAPETDVNQIRPVFALTLDRFDLAESDVASVAGELFDYYDKQICSLVGRLEGAEPSLLAEIRGEALSARMISTLHAIDRHIGALTSQPGRRTEAEFLVRYRRHVAEQHGKLEPPDFERRRRVPVASLYVTPQIFQMVETDRERAPRKLDLWQFAEELDRTVLLGDPGGGKTTAANVLMHRHAVDQARRIPFLVTLREFAAQDPPERSVAGHIEHLLETLYQCPAPPGLIDRLLLTGRALVIFDGLDELLDTSRRADVTTRVERFCSEYPLSAVLVTARLVGYDQARLDDRQFARYRIGGFADEQVSEYVRKWFAQEEGIDVGNAARWATSFIEESAATPDLRANPLMLALMCILYRGEGALPRHHAEVYEQCANLLFRKWDARRRIHMELQAGNYLEPALRHLAWWLFSRDQRQAAVTERELVDEATVFLLERGFESEPEAREAASEFVSFCRGRMWVFSDTGTTAAGEALYSFTHRTFLEYFSAAHLAYGCDTPERLARSLAPHVARHEWDVVSELAVQIKDRTSDRGAQRIYAALLSEQRRRTPAGRGGVLQFLARCVRSVDLSPQTIRDVARAALDHLFGGDLSDPVRCLPLCWLLASCAGYKDVVDHEIGVRISNMAASSNASSRLKGLQLALWLPVGISGDWGGDGPRVSSDSSLWGFWQECRAKYMWTHSESIIAVAADDIGTRLGALLHGLITMDRALQMPGDIHPFFQHQSIEIFGIRYGAYLPDIINGLILGWPGYYDPADRSPVPKKIDDLAAVGRYLIHHPQPPWLVGGVDAWSDFIWNDPMTHDTSHIVLEPTAYLGAVAILLIGAESTTSRLLPLAGPRKFGPFGDLYSYIERRWHIEPDCTLLDLPVPDEFQSIFRDWADKRVSFVDASPPGGRQ